MAQKPAPPDPDRLKELEAKLARLKGSQAGPPPTEEHYSQAQVAWRMVTELVAGLAIGFGIGYGLDALLDTRPLFMVLFVFLGFAAGIKTMMRTAREVQKDADDRSAKDGSDTRGD